LTKQAPLKTGVQRSRSCSTSGARRITLATHPVASY